MQVRKPLADYCAAERLPALVPAFTGK